MKSFVAKYVLQNCDFEDSPITIFDKRLVPVTNASFFPEVNTNVLIFLFVCSHHALAHLQAVNMAVDRKSTTCWHGRCKQAYQMVFGGPVNDVLHGKRGTVDECQVRGAFPQI